MNRGSSPRATRRVLVALYVLLPLVVLAIDFAASPVVFETTQPLTISVLSLFERARVPLGVFRSHQIEMGLSNVGRADYLMAYRDRKPNALTVSVFAVEKEDEGETETTWTTGAYTRAVLAKLKGIAPTQARNLDAFLDDTAKFQPGDVRTFAVTLTPEQRAKFPVDWIFVAVLEQANGEKNGDHFSTVFKSLSKAAVEKDVATLILPAIGHNWQDDHAAGFDEIFRGALDSLNANRAPALVYFDLYDGWPTFVVERAVTALNAAAEHFVKPVASERVLHHRDRRLLLILLTLCLAASAFVAPLTFRAFLIISGAYIGLYFTIGGTMNLFTDTFTPDTRLVVQVAIYVILAIAFPFIAHWNLDIVFGTKEEA